MSEISNKSLATLLVVAIVVSLGGTFISLNRLSSLGTIPGITGFQTGKVNVSIVQVLTISTPDALIWFGEGTVDDVSSEFAELWSNSTERFWNNATTFLPDPSDDGIGDYIILRNDGNVDLNLTIYTHTNASEYLCGGLVGASFTHCYDTASYAYWTVENETNSCLAADDAGDSTNRIELFGNGTIPKQNVCGRLESAEDSDTVKLYVYLNISQYVVGSKNDTLYFTASKVT